MSIDIPRYPVGNTEHLGIVVVALMNVPCFALIEL